jgi:nucleoside-diphosphate-sugar epimerase
MAAVATKHILIGGGSGFIGKGLTSHLNKKGHKVCKLIHQILIQIRSR